MISRTVHIDLTNDDRDLDRNAVRDLVACEPGTHVILFVGDRRMVTNEIDHFRTFVPALHLDVHGRPGAARAWEDALHGRGIWGDV